MPYISAAKRFAPIIITLLAALCAASSCMPLSSILPGGQQSYFDTGLPHEYTYFTMGGIRIKMAGPEGYISAPTGSQARQAASLTLSPPENIFAVFLPSAQSSLPATGTPLHNRRFVVVSARPEFMDEYVEMQFFQALRKDLQRVNGSWETDSLEDFKRLTSTYYKNQDSFTHSLGVFHSTRYSLSIARIVREGGSLGKGAISSYPAPSGANMDDPDARWFKTYFAGAYHTVVVQNVVLLGGRYFNVYFSAPLAEAADIAALMEENTRYMNMLASAARTGEIGQEGGPVRTDSTSGAEVSGKKTLYGKDAPNLEANAPL